MKSLNLLLLLIALGVVIPASSQSNAPDYKNIYLNARKALLYPAAYKEEGFLTFFESWMAVDRNNAYNSILRNSDQPSEELLLALNKLKTSYEALTQIHKYHEVALDIWEGHQTIPVPGGREDNSLDSADAWLADDPGFRPFLMDYRLKNPSEAKGTIITIPSIRGAYDELTLIAKTFNELGFNVFALQGRMNTVNRRYYGLQLDAQRAVRYLRFHAKELGIDPEKIVSIGGSKGNFTHIMTYEYFDKTPVQYAAEVLKKPLKDYVCDAIDTIPSHVSALIYSYGSFLLGKDFSAQTIRNSHIYSKEMYEAGYRYPHMVVLAGNYDHMDIPTLPVVITALSDYNKMSDRLYEIGYEVHISDKVEHGFGSGYKYPNMKNLWDAVGVFLEMNLGK
ncbi:MAG: hypothetical protein JXQ80_12485 [Bacteroidales bacterium]|nr:hypothetical protein [Bacteroidales bacterium]